MPQMSKVELYVTIRRDHRGGMRIREIDRKTPTQPSLQKVRLIVSAASTCQRTPFLSCTLSVFQDAPDRLAAPAPTWVRRAGPQSDRLTPRRCSAAARHSPGPDRYAASIAGR